VLGESIIALAFGLLGWSARSANVLAAAVATLPSYLLNRAWVWGRTGRSHLLREVLPFWAIAFAGLAASTWVAGHAEDLAAALTDTRALQTAVVMTAVLATYGAIWVGRFVILEGLLFAERGVPADA
jgi:putative flippase GtrA